MTDIDRIDRRQFAQCLSAVSGAAALMLASANQSVAADDPQKPPAKADAPAGQVDVSLPKSLAQEVVLLKILMERYPSDRFDEAAVKGIVNDLRGDLARGRILSRFGLKNSDEPCSVFRAYRSPE